MGRNERAVAHKNAPVRGGEGEERLQCYRTVERGIAESRDGGKGEGKGERRRARDRDGAKLVEERERVQPRYVVCAWRGWRLPHEALRAELSYPHIRTYIAERGAGPDLITLPYT